MCEESVELNRMQLNATDSLGRVRYRNRGVFYKKFKRFMNEWLARWEEKV